MIQGFNLADAWLWIKPEYVEVLYPKVKEIAQWRMSLYDNGGSE